MLKTHAYLRTRLARVSRDEAGATAVEYGIMVALIAAVIIAVVATIGTDLLAAFTTVDNQLPAAN